MSHSNLDWPEPCEKSTDRARQPHGFRPPSASLRIRRWAVLSVAASRPGSLGGTPFPAVCEMHHSKQKPYHSTGFKISRHQEGGEKWNASMRSPIAGMFLGT